MDEKDHRDLYQREESTKDYLKTLLGADTQVDEIDSVDLPDVNNPQYVCEYVNEVMTYLRETEVNNIIVESKIKNSPRKNTLPSLVQ